MGQVDSTDWAFDNAWTSSENALMQTPTSAQLLNTENAVVTMYPSYPNPLFDIAGLAFNTSKPALLQMVVTDNLLTVKFRKFITTNSGINNLQIMFATNDYTNNKNYRLYYGFYSANGGLFYKGHGDLAIRR